MSKYYKIGLIGYGNMGAVIAHKASKNLSVIVFDKIRSKLKSANKLTKAKSLIQLAKKAQTIILAVKPQDYPKVLAEIGALIENKLVVSIAAGITIKAIEKKLAKSRVVRAMPNMLASHGKSITFIAKGKTSSLKDIQLTKKIFKNLGKVFLIKESMMDKATAVSGSGPGYYYDYQARKESNDKDFQYALTQSTCALGFNPGVAQETAKVIVTIGSKILSKSKLNAVELRDQVVSKGGTTEAALKVIHKHRGFLKSCTPALKAAVARGKQLAKKIKL